ncbi:hypothetical protein HY468_03385 [Candidatus Roizmanbacteria bacterium]|nr:hypothetical protein [Candidatus Roizmanbacteria bacterium]
MTPEQPKEINLYTVFDDMNQGVPVELPGPELIEETVRDAMETSDERTEFHKELLTQEDVLYASQSVNSLLELNREYENLDRTAQETHQLVSELSTIWETRATIQKPSIVLYLPEEEERLKSLEGREAAIHEQLTATANRLLNFGGIDPEVAKRVDVLELLSQSQVNILRQLEQALNWIDGIVNTALVGNYMRSVNKQFADRWQLKQRLPPSEGEQETEAGQWEWFIGTRPPKENKTQREQFDERVREYEKLISDVKGAFKLDDEHISDTEILQLLPGLNALQLAHFGKYGSFDTGTDEKTDRETEVLSARSERRVGVMLAAIERFLTLNKRKEEQTDEPLEIIEPAWFIEQAILMISPHFDFASHYASIVNQTGRYTPIAQEFDTVMAMLTDYKTKLGDLRTPYIIKPSTKIEGAYELPNGEVVTGKQAVSVLERLMQTSAENRCSVEDLRMHVYPHLEPDAGKAGIHRRISVLRTKGVPIPRVDMSDPNAGYYIDRENPLVEQPNHATQDTQPHGKPDKPPLPFQPGSKKLELATSLANCSEANPISRDELIKLHYEGDPLGRSHLSVQLSKIRQTSGVILHEDEGGLWLEIIGAKQVQSTGEGQPEKPTYAQKLEQNIYSIKQKLEEETNKSNARLTEKETTEIVSQCIDADIITPGVRKAIENMFLAAQKLRASLRSDRKGEHLRGATFFQRHVDVLASLLNEKGDVDTLSDDQIITIQSAINESLALFLSSRMGGDDRSYDILALNATLNAVLWIRKSFPEATIRSVAPRVYYHDKIGMQIILDTHGEYDEEVTVYVAKKGIARDKIEHYEINHREQIYEYIRDQTWRETFSTAFDYVQKAKKPNDRFMIILAPNALPSITK